MLEILQSGSGGEAAFGAIDGSETGREAAGAVESRDYRENMEATEAIGAMEATNITEAAAAEAAEATGSAAGAGGAEPAQAVSREEYERVLAELAAIREDFGQKLGRQRCEAALELEAERLLWEAGARNHQAVRGLLGLDQVLAELTAKGGEAELGAGEGWRQALRERVRGLCEAPETAFLFASEPGGMEGWIGFSPAAAGDDDDFEDEGGFRLRLAQAMGEQDSLAAIKVKQEAAASGVFL